MAAPDTSPYVLATPDTALPNSRTLAASGGLSANDTGPTNSVTITTVGNLANLNTFNTGGFVAYDLSNQIFIPKTLVAGTGIIIMSADAQGGDTSISVDDNTTTQKVQVEANGVSAGPSRAVLNFIPGPNTSITAADAPLDGRINIIIGTSTSFAPETAKYIVQTPDAGLPNAQALSALSTGLMKVTTGTGVISTADAGTDYQSASAHLTNIAGLLATSGELIVGTGSSFGGITIGAAGTVLTSNGTQAGWQPSPSSGGNWTVNNLASGGSVLMAPNTSYNVGNIGATSFRLPSSSATIGDIYMVTKNLTNNAAVSITGVSLPSYIVKITSGNTDFQNIAFTANETGFVWMIFVGFNASTGFNEYQILNSQNITLS